MSTPLKVIDVSCLSIDYLPPTYLNIVTKV
jgi:hypothetical protein